MEATYTVVLMRQDDGGYCVSVPALKGCHTEGDTLPEALEMASEAILAYLDGERELGKPVPPPDVRSFTIDIGDAVEASIHRLAVRLEAAVPVA